MHWYDVLTIGLFMGGFLMLPILWELWDGERFRSLVGGSIALGLLGAPISFFLVLDGSVESQDRLLLAGVAICIALLMMFDQLWSRLVFRPPRAEESLECRQRRGLVAYLRRVALLHSTHGRSLR